MSAGFKVVIPARYASTRLPAKPLADIGGQPMVVRVMQRAQLAGADEVWVATDRVEVAQAVEAAGGQFVMTSPDHPSGTDRLAEVVQLLGWPDDTVIVNVQGDEPLIEPAIISRVARLLGRHSEAAMATAAHAIHGFEEFLSPSVVKVVCDAAGRGTYFSRAPIPYPRDLFAAGIPASGALPPSVKAARHVGLYAYRASFLRAYAKLSPAPYETIEMLEQLRALWHGFEIYVEMLEQAPPGGVDTAEDLERVRSIFAAA